MTLKSSIYRKSCGFTNYSWSLAHALGLFSDVHPSTACQSTLEFQALKSTSTLSWTQWQETELWNFYPNCKDPPLNRWNYRFLSCLPWQFCTGGSHFQNVNIEIVHACIHVVTHNARRWLFLARQSPGAIFFSPKQDCHYETMLAPDWFKTLCVIQLGIQHVRAHDMSISSRWSRNTHRNTYSKLSWPFGKVADRCWLLPK